MEKIVEVIAKGLVAKPEDISVQTQESEDQVTISLYLDKDDMGRMIGRRGRIANNIRTILQAVGKKRGQEVNLEIKEK